MSLWITFLKPDTALVHATWEWPGCKQPSSEEWKDFNGIITMVLVKRNDKWLIRALQNTVTSPPPKQGAEVNVEKTST